MAGGATVGEAVVLASERPEPGKETPGEGGEFDVSDFGVGRHALRLEVRLPGQEPYEVEGRFKVPKEVQFGKRAPFLLRPLMKRNPVPVGITLPVSVDPAKPDEVTIDWDGFLAAGGRDEMKKGNEAAAAQKLAQRYPKEVAQMRENAKRELPMLVTGVRGGTVKRKDFDQTLETYVRNGYLQAEEAEAARAELDGS
jgi:hypothetical protein